MNTHAPIPGTLRDALQEADMRVLPMVLFHLTGDRRWLSERYRPSLDLGGCHFCQKRLDTGDPAEYEAGAFCRGDRLLRPVVVICATCSEKSQESLSDQTRKAWGDFVDENLPGVPFDLEPDTIPMTF